MGYAALQRKPAYRVIGNKPLANNYIACDWTALRTQLLQQWGKISDRELEATGHNRHDIAKLIQRKYGVSTEMAENYLCNFERTLPLRM